MTEYIDVLNNPYLSQQQKIDEINRIGEAERTAIDIENQKAQNRIKRGSALQVASSLPILNIPYVGTGIGGGLYEAGNAIMEGKDAQGIWDDAKRGFIIGESVGAIPYVGKYAGKTKAGKAVGNKASSLFSKLMETNAGQKLGDFAKKAEDVLMTDIKAFNPNKQTVYHGSPADFNKFDNAYIGTGEGAQAHGHGHYSALDKDIADTRYREGVLAQKGGTKWLLDGKELPKDWVYPNGYNSGFYAPALYREIEENGIEKTLQKVQNKLSNKMNEVAKFEKMYDERTINEIPQLSNKYDYLRSEVNSFNSQIDFLKNNLGKKITKDEGQLYKLSIPKDDVMLREGATFAEQPVKVQEMYRQAQKNKLAERLNEIQETKDFLYQELENAKKNGSDRLIYATEQMLNDELPTLNRWTDDITEQLKHIDNNNYYDNLDYRALLTNLLPENSRPAFGHLTNKESQTISEQLNKAGIKGISYNGGIDGEARVIFNPDDIDIVRKYYNQPELWQTLKGLKPNEGAELMAIENVLRSPQFPMNETDFKNYENLGLNYYQHIFQPNSVEIPGYGTVTFGRKNRGKDDITNFRMYPDLFELLQGSKKVNRTNYKNEIDREYDYLENPNNKLYQFLIEDIAEKGKRYKMMQNKKTGK